MEEVIKYFESLEARIAALEEAQQTNEAIIASLEAEVEELKNRPAAEPQVVEKVIEKIVEKPVEVIKEVVGETPAAVETPEPVIPMEEPKPEVTPAAPAAPEPVIEEQASPKAAVYGKAVDDIRMAISLGDRFLYQRELFGQNAELMQRTLTELNELGSYEDAIQHISRFNWDSESNTYQQFLVTLHRRFG